MFVRYNLNNNIRLITKKSKRRCKKSKSISDLMDLKELCKKVDRIAILERCEPADQHGEFNKRLIANKKRPRNTAR